MNRPPIIETNDSKVREYWVDKIAGLVAPLCLFVEPAKYFLLTTAEVYDVETFAVPVSLVLSPIYLLFFFHRGFQKYMRFSPFLLLIALFILYCLVMGALNAVLRDGQAILYAYQWILPFMWLPYFLAIVGTQRFSTFARWMVYGMAFNLGWYALSAVLEFVLYGGLGDAGRLTQNRILPGQYQIAVYVPTAIAASMSLINGMILSGSLELKRKYFVALNGLTLLVLLALAAREGLLTYLLATVLLYAVRSAYLQAAIFFGAVILGALVIINLNTLFEVFAASDFRILNKIATLQEEGARFGGREIMIRESIQVFFWDPLFGSRFLPPNVSVFGDAILAPSAHNMYVDAFVWCGLFGGLMFLAISLRLLLGSVGMIADRRSEVPSYMKYVGVVLLVFLVVSNNTNVPMRQPIAAPIVAMLIAFVMRYALIKTCRQI